MNKQKTEKMTQEPKSKNTGLSRLVGLAMTKPSPVEFVITPLVEQLSGEIDLQQILIKKIPAQSI